MSTAVYPGSFDPITKGHLNIMERAAKTFDKLIVCVMVNGDKNPMFSLEERVEMIRRVTGHIPQIVVDHSDALLADYAKSQNAHVIVKGLRAVSDFEREFQMSIINHKLNPGLDTMFLTAEHQFMFLSSSAVKEMGYYEADLTDFLPHQIIPDFTKRIKEIKEGG